MISINIPESRSKMSAQDELVKYILNELSNKNECTVHYCRLGIATGCWYSGEHPWKRMSCDQHEASLEVIREVASAFSEKGYLVEDKLLSGNGAELFVKK